MLGISWDQISAQVRNALVFVGGYAVAKGWISEPTMLAIVGIAVTVIGALWSAKVNTPTALVQSAAAIPDVKKIELTNTMEGRKIESATPAKVVVDPRA